MIVLNVGASRDESKRPEEAADTRIYGILLSQNKLNKRQCSCFFKNLNMGKVVFPALLELRSPFICISHFKILF